MCPINLFLISLFFEQFLFDDKDLQDSVDDCRERKREREREREREIFNTINFENFVTFTLYYNDDYCQKMLVIVKMMKIDFIFLKFFLHSPII